MLSKKLEKQLNEQMNFEIESAHIYLAMAGAAADMGLAGLENWLMCQYEEELFHAKKFFNFINEKGGRVEIKGFENPANDYANSVTILEEALAHEKKVTARIYDLVNLAYDEKEHATVAWLNWFVTEQTEEEDTLVGLITKAKMVKDAGLYLFDQELAQRTFTEPTTK